VYARHTPSAAVDGGHGRIAGLVVGALALLIGVVSARHL
jgi:hypothetical protein